MALLPVHPRIAHMLLVAREHGAGKLAADIAAILGERDFVHGVNGPPDADIELRLQMLHSGSRGSTGSGSGEVDFATMHRAAAEAAALKQQLDLRNARVPVRQTMPTAGALLGLAYPDRIAKARTRDADGSFLLRNGRGAVLSHPQALSSAEFIVAAELDGDTRAARIFLGASLTRAELEEYYQDQFEVRRIVEWNDHSSAVEARTETRLGAIVLNESRDAKPDVDVALALLIDAIRREGTAALPWTRTATQLRDRMAFMHGRADGWPDVSDTALMESLNEWLAPNLRGHTSLHGIESEIENAISNMLDWRQRSELDRLAPTHYVAPTGSRIPIDYGNPDAPAVAVRLQEMFGVATTPTIDDGKVALILQLLSPARRPVQVTRDIAGFWRGSYFDVRKELRGRYPKHVWPDDPLAQSPTTRTKPRR
jgi:ATP-dependent helicase HrpB